MTGRGHSSSIELARVSRWLKELIRAVNLTVPRLKKRVLHESRHNIIPKKGAGLPFDLKGTHGSGDHDLDLVIQALDAFAVKHPKGRSKVDVKEVILSTVFYVNLQKSPSFNH